MNNAPSENTVSSPNAVTHTNVGLLEATPGDYRPVETGAAHESPKFQVPGYEILSELGRGGMGVVYRARQVRANRDVALKMILSGNQAGTIEVARFQIEAEAVARLQHPNIVAVYEVGEYDGRPYFSMEYCSSGSLASTGGQPMPPRTAAELLLKICRGVAAAHDAGIVHRDLKPGNILITADGTPKVSDFGLAKEIGGTSRPAEREVTGSGAVLGTPSYMAPEQAGGAKRVGPAADVYALGAILYELLTARPPFKGPTPTETILLLLTEDPLPPRETHPEIPRDLELVCLRCLEKDPARRYPSAALLAEDLVRFLEGEPVSAARSGLVGRLVSSIDRVQMHERFGRYGNLLLALAPVMLLPELIIFWLLTSGESTQFAWMVRAFQATTFIGLVGHFLGWRFAPKGPAERQVWAIWAGYFLAAFTYGLSVMLMIGESERVMEFYPGFACLTALAFFAMAAGTWGYAAVIGAGFLALSFVMCINPKWALIEFGIAWAVVLVLIGLRARKLGRVSASIHE